MSASLPSLRFWKLRINSVPFASTSTRGLLGKGTPFLRHVTMIGSSPCTRQSSMSWRSLTAITSLGSRRNDSSDAKQPPANTSRRRKWVQRWKCCMNTDLPTWDDHLLYIQPQITYMNTFMFVGLSSAPKWTFWSFWLEAIPSWHLLSHSALVVQSKPSQKSKWNCHSEKWGVLALIWKNFYTEKQLGN